MKKIGLLGGTFDPIHLGHLILANYAKDVLNLDMVYFIPAYVSPFKVNKEDLFTPKLRKELVELAIKDNDNFKLLDLELRKQTISYSYETVLEVKKIHPDDTLYFIIGLDNLEKFHLWKNPHIILKNAYLAVGRRPVELKLQEVLDTLNRQGLDIGKIVIFESPRIEISSSMIRELIRNGRDFRYLVPDRVYKRLKKILKKL